MGDWLTPGFGVALVVAVFVGVCMAWVTSP